MPESHLTLFGLAVGLAFIAIGAGMRRSYGQERRGGGGAAPPEFLVGLFGRFRQAAHACLLAGILIVAVTLIAGDGIGSWNAALIPITLYYAAALGVLLVILTFNVLRHRVRALLDNFGHPDPVADRIVRVHANFGEYVPTGLVLLLALEWSGAPAYVVHFGGSVFTLGRYLHAWGFTHGEGASFGRIVGIQATLFALAYMVACAVLQILFR